MIRHTQMWHTICVIIYEWFLILKIFELDFVNFDSDNDKNPRKMSIMMSFQAGIHKPLRRESSWSLNLVFWNQIFTLDESHKDKNKKN